MAKSVLITGGSGLIGSQLTRFLLDKGYAVRHLSRREKKGAIPSFVWSPKDQCLDPKALEGVNSIIHLAGAGVADKRWTVSRKREILESRTKSTKLLFDSLKDRPHDVRVVVSASGVGYYGFQNSATDLDENVPPGKDFLADVTRQWEAAADHISGLGIRLVKLRTGMVLSAEGGALQKLSAPVRFYVGASLGTGKQWTSWIHIDDLCGIYLKALEDDKMIGAYNAVAPNPVTNDVLTNKIAKALARPIWLPNVPGFLLRLALGQLAEMVLNGSHVSGKKVIQAGYRFRFQNLEDALQDLLSKSRSRNRS